MKIILLLTALSMTCTGTAATEAEEAKKSIRALIEPILQKEQKDPKTVLKDFSVEKCEKYKINWINVILMRKEAALKYTFKPGCDIEGTVNPTVIKPFPVDLKLKNLDHFNRLQSENTITASLETEPVLNLAVRTASLTGAKGIVKFEADYAVKINPLKQKKEMISENIGGEIRITEIYGKKVSIKEKIKVE
jgi:hypothetical protein